MKKNFYYMVTINGRTYYVESLEKNSETHAMCRVLYENVPCSETDFSGSVVSIEEDNIPIGKNIYILGSWKMTMGKRIMRRNSVKLTVKEVSRMLGFDVEIVDN